MREKPCYSFPETSLSLFSHTKILYSVQHHIHTNCLCSFTHMWLCTIEIDASQEHNVLKIYSERTAKMDMTSVFVSILSIHNTEYTKHITRTVFLILFSFCLIFAKHCAKATVFKWVCVHSFSMYVCTYIDMVSYNTCVCRVECVCIEWL